MTEITVKKSNMPSAVERFVLHWGEMGTRWGVNRSVGQIHALLYLSEKATTAEDIAETLGMARSNVSTSLRELISWGLVRRVHVMGDRRDFFEAETDLWEMLMRISAGRKAREIDPAVNVLMTCVSEAKNDPKMNKEARERLSEMLDFVEALSTWYEQILKIPKWKLLTLMKMGGAIAKFAKSKKDVTASRKEKRIVTPKE